MKLGVIGAGRWGVNLIRVCAELGVLESICEANEAALATIGAKYPDVALECDVPSLLQRNIDAVVVAAPAPLHAELCIEAIAAGKHVFVEKPLAMSPNEAATVVRAAQAGGRTLFVGHVLLYHPAVQRMIGLIRDGTIGSVRHLRSRRLSWGTLRAQENVWWSFAPHDVALALAIFDAMPENASGSLSAFIRPEIADFAYADLRFTQGRSAHIEVSWLDPDKSSRVDVFGSRGVLRLLDSRDGATLTFTPCGSRGTGNEIELWREESRTVAFTPTEPLGAELRAFLNVIERGTRSLTDGEHGQRVVEVLSMLAAHSHPSLEAIA